MFASAAACGMVGPMPTAFTPAPAPCCPIFEWPKASFIKATAGYTLPEDCLVVFCHFSLYNIGP